MANLEDDYESINFEGIDDDLAAFQEDEMVQQALQRGVDLRKYGGDLGKDLKKVGFDMIVVNVGDLVLFVFGFIHTGGVGLC